MRATKNKVTIAEVKNKQRAVNEVVAPINYRTEQPGNKSRNAELLKRYRFDKDKSALDELVKINMGLVSAQALKYLGTLNSSIDFDDLMQLGTIGLLIAAEKFDMDRIDEISFSTYAIWWIKQSIGRGIADTSSAIRIPVHLYEKYYKILKAEQIACTQGDSFTEQDLKKACKAIGMDVKKYESIKNVLAPLSLNMDLHTDEDDGSELLEFIPSSDNVEDVAMFNNQIENLVDDIKEILSDKEMDVLRYRFGLDDGISMTLQECGDALGFTRERARQIESKALRKLRENIEFRSKYSPKKMTDMEKEILERRLFAKKCREAIKAKKEEVKKNKTEASVNKKNI